jgi:hypothetical protein
MVHGVGISDNIGGRDRTPQSGMAHCDMAERLTDVVLPIVAGWLHAMVPLNIKRLGPQVDGSPSVAQTGVDL